MFRRLATVAGLCVALVALWLAPSSVAQEQVLTWTANESMTDYASFPATAVAGEATIVFENSEATGNTSGMQHTLTFDTSTPGYNHDVSLNLVASPFDSNGGRHEAQVTLSPGKYRYFCSVPGHGEMTGELVVTEGGGGDDTTAPEVTADVSGDQDADGNYIGAATVTLSATDSGSGVDSVEYEIDDTGFQPYNGPVTIDQPGDHSVQYRATDIAGNTSETGSVQFRVVEGSPDDTTPPEVTAQVSGDQNDSGGYIGSASVALSATDAGSGVAGIEYNLDGAGFEAYAAPVTVNTAGEHTVAYRATDNAGNTSAEGSVSFTVVEPSPDDTTPPDVTAEVTGDQDADGNYVGSATVALSATDPGSGVARIEYNLDGAGYQPYTEPITVDTTGEHTVAYRATDNSGNTSPEGSVTLTISEPGQQDTTPPEVAAQVGGDQDADGNYVGTATVTLSATDEESGVESVVWALDGGSFGPYTEPVAVSEPGEHTLRYRATDHAGNNSEIGSVSFTVVEIDPGDTDPPEVTAQLTGPQDAHWNYVGTATVTLSANDAESGVRFLRYSLDGGSYTAYGEPVKITEPGEHTVLYHAVDQAGNRSTDGKLTFSLVAEASDACVGSDVGKTVVVGTHDSTVRNAGTGDGCTVADLVGQRGDHATAGEFTAHVKQVTGKLHSDGVLSDAERSRILTAASG